MVIGLQIFDLLFLLLNNINRLTCLSEFLSAGKLRCANLFLLLPSLLCYATLPPTFPTTFPSSLPPLARTLQKRAPLTFFQLPAFKMWSQSWTRSFNLNDTRCSDRALRKTGKFDNVAQTSCREKPGVCETAFRTTYCWWGWQAGRSGTRGWGLLSLDRAQPVSLGMKKSAHFSQHWSFTHWFNWTQMQLPISVSNLLWNSLCLNEPEIFNSFCAGNCKSKTRKLATNAYIQIHTQKC